MHSFKENNPQSCMLSTIFDMTCNNSACCIWRNISTPHSLIDQYSYKRFSFFFLFITVHYIVSTPFYGQVDKVNLHRNRLDNKLTEGKS